MSSQQYKDNSRRDDRRPTLPPIRDIFAAELSQTIVPSHNHSSQSSASSSPRIGLQRLSLSDDGSSHASSSWAGSSGRTHSSFDSAGARSDSPALQARTASEPAYRSAAHPAYPPYGHPPAVMTRHIDPNVLATSGYPYAASQPLPQFSHPSSSLGRGGRATDPSADRTSSTSGRYECQWCGRSFTRPSSLKIHMNTHTGEKPYVCPFEGCGRSFSVQSNMRRHSRVHTKQTDAPGETEDYESEGSESAAAARRISHSRADSASTRSSQSQTSSRRS